MVPSADHGVTLGWIGTGPRTARVRFGWAEDVAKAPPRGLGPSQSLERGCSSVAVPGQPPGGTARLWVELETGDGALDFIALSSPPASVTR
jgi:hypothetical protein